MRKPTEVEAGAMRRICDSADGQILLNYLIENLDAQDIENRIMPVDIIQRGQGKAIVINDLIEKLTAHRRK